MTTIILFMMSFLFQILANAKSVVKKYEFHEDNLMSPSLFNLINRYRNTMNANYRTELRISIYMKILSSVCIVGALILMFI